MTSNQLVQMALSAILRCKEQVDLFDLNDILRGKLSKNVKQKGYNSIKTFGVGKIYSKTQWHYWIIQMIQQELFYIDYDDNDYLKVLERGHQVLKGEMDITLKRLSNESFTISKNGSRVCIDLDIQDSIDWKSYLDTLGKTIYFNIKDDYVIDVNRIIPFGIAERERVKAKYLEIANKLYNLRVEGEKVIIPPKVDYDIYGNEVQPLSLPFEECLSRLEQFVKNTGRYPQMKAIAEEVALRKWYRDVSNGNILTTMEQRMAFMHFVEQYPMQQKTNAK